MGIRNYTAVIPTVNCMNETAVRIADGIDGAVALPHIGRCAFLGADQTRLLHTLARLGRNPNVSGALVVGLGCEASTAEQVVEQMTPSTRPTELLTVEKEGNAAAMIGKARALVSRMAADSAGLEREPVELSDMTLAIKCGGSDTTSGVSGNAVAGRIADRVVDAGGTVVFTETAEILGGEQLLARRAVSDRVREKLLRMVGEKEAAIKAMGVDLRRCEPTPGNIQGGLTTIEEKSLGCIVKAGSRPLQGVLDWGGRPEERGLFFMDGPSHTTEICAGVASAGAQIMIFSQGGGLPSMLPMVPAQSSRFPIMPVVKMSGNPHGYEERKDQLDIYVGSILEGRETVEQAADRAFDELLAVVSGRERSYSERYTSYVEPLNLYFTGPLV